MKRLFVLFALMTMVLASFSLITVAPVGATGSPPAECLLPNPPQSCAPNGVGATGSPETRPECLGANPPQSCAPNGVGATGSPETRPECLGANPPQSCAPNGVGPSGSPETRPECLGANPPQSCLPDQKPKVAVVLVKVGAACKKAGLKGAASGGALTTCTKVGKKLIWVQDPFMKVGLACKKAGTTSAASGGVSLTCTMVSKKLVWQKTKVKAVASPSPSVRPTASPSPSATPTASPSPTPSPTNSPAQAFEYKLPAEYQKIFAGPDWVQSPQLPKDFIVGHTITDYFSDVYSKLVDSTLTSVKQSGVGWVAFDNYNTYTSVEPPVIGSFPITGYRDYHMREASDAELTAMIKNAHAKGLKFALFNEVNLDGLSAGSNGVTPELLADQAKFSKRLQELAGALSNPTPEITKYWDDWFKMYGDFIMHQADIAQQNGVEMFSIGKQLGAITASENVGRFNALIKKVREHYKGQLVYVALEGKDFSEAQGFPAWAALDAIVMTVGNNAPDTAGKTVAQIRDAMKTVLTDRYKPIATQYGKKVILLTYFQAATAQNWFESGPLTGGHDFIVQDQLAQAQLYEALFQAIKNEAWISGVLTWSYWWKDDLTTLVVPGDSAYDKSSNVRDMPAMEIIKKWAVR